MSTGSKITLLGSSLSAIGIVYFVHMSQKWEQAVCNVLGIILRWNLWLTYQKAMHEGVVRDMAQQKIKKERQADFDMQRQLEEEYKKVQSLSQSDGG